MDRTYIFSLELQIYPNKSQKGLPLETKNTQNHENRRLGLILFTCNTVVCEAVVSPYPAGRVYIHFHWVYLFKSTSAPPRPALGSRLSNREGNVLYQKASFVCIQGQSVE